MEIRLRELHRSRLQPSSDLDGVEINKSVDVHYCHTKNGCFECHGCEVSHDDATGGSAVSG